MRPSRTVTVGAACLGVVGVSILVFGLVVFFWPGTTDPGLMRADGLASVGTGLLGILISLVPYRRVERWAWWVLWFYPLFWAVHLIAGLPPGKDHVHQILGIAVALIGLLLPVRLFFPGRRSAGETTN